MAQINSSLLPINLARLPLILKIVPWFGLKKPVPSSRPCRESLPHSGAPAKSGACAGTGRFFPAWEKTPDPPFGNGAARGAGFKRQPG